MYDPDELQPTMTPAQIEAALHTIVAERESSPSELTRKLPYLICAIVGFGIGITLDYFGLGATLAIIIFILWFLWIMRPEQSL